MRLPLSPLAGIARQGRGPRERRGERREGEQTQALFPGRRVSQCPQPESPKTRFFGNVNVKL